MVEFAILKAPQILNAVRHVPTEADAGSDGEEGEEAAETKVQAKQHFVEQAASWVRVVAEQECGCCPRHAVESQGGQQHSQEPAAVLGCTCLPKGGKWAVAWGSNSCFYPLSAISPQKTGETCLSHLAYSHHTPEFFHTA